MCKNNSTIELRIVFNFPPCNLELIAWKQQEKKLVELYGRLLGD